MSVDHLIKVLCPPGFGVYTVHTGSELRQPLLEAYYGEADPELTWQAGLSYQIRQDNPLVLGVCSDAGGAIHRGANWGPLCLREKFLSEKNFPKFCDIGDVRVIPHLLTDDYLTPSLLASCRKALYQDDGVSLPVSPLSIAEFAAKTIYQINAKAKIFSLGGDHSIAYPLVASYLKTREKGSNAAVIHFDAHTDLMPSRLGVPLCFASWARHVLPYLSNPNHFIQIGIRSTTQSQAQWEEECGVTQYWAETIKQQGMDIFKRRLVQKLKELQIDEVYVSFDIDVLDSSEASATGTPESGGLFVDQCEQLLLALNEHVRVTGADLVEVAPFISNAYSHTNQPEPETTLKSATRIARVLLQGLHQK